MCGSFQVLRETLADAETLAASVSLSCAPEACTGVLKPPRRAALLRAEGAQVTLTDRAWGLASPFGPQLIINARAESAAQKPLFRAGMAKHRIAIPAACFHERTPRGALMSFRRSEEPTLYLAGLLGLLQGEERFVILTRAANPSVAPVHARMPVLLPPGSLHAWFFEPERVPALLLAEPGPLSCSPISASPAQPELPGFFTP